MHDYGKGTFKPMKRRAFLTNLAATAALPMVPFKALASTTPAAAASVQQPYLWASFITRVHNNASPSMLQRLLKLDEGVAKQVYSELVKNNVVTSPNAYGISRAVNPFPQPGMAHLQSRLSSKVVKTSDKALKLNTSEDSFEKSEDSPPVNQEMTASEDEHILNESQPDATDPDGTA
jgi:hypothetical protein